MLGYLDLPHRYSLYVDANIILKAGIEAELRRYISSAYSLAFYLHKKNRTLLSEAIYCYLVGKINFRTLFSTLRFCHFYLRHTIQGGVIFRDKTNENVRKAMEKWFSLVRMVCERDQVVAPIVIYDANHQPIFNILDGDLYRHDFLEIVPHNTSAYGPNGDVLTRDGVQILISKLFGF